MSCDSMLERADKTYAVVQDGNAIMRLVEICLEIHILQTPKTTRTFLYKTMVAYINAGTQISPS